MPKLQMQEVEGWVLPTLSLHLSPRCGQMGGRRVTGSLSQEREDHAEGGGCEVLGPVPQSPAWGLCGLC